MQPCFNRREPRARALRSRGRRVDRTGKNVLDSRYFGARSLGYRQRRAVRAARRGPTSHPRVYECRGTYALRNHHMHGCGVTTPRRARLSSRRPGDVDKCESRAFAFHTESRRHRRSGKNIQHQGNVVARSSGIDWRSSICCTSDRRNSRAHLEQCVFSCAQRHRRVRLSKAVYRASGERQGRGVIRPELLL